MRDTYAVRSHGMTLALKNQPKDNYADSRLDHPRSAAAWSLAAVPLQYGMGLLPEWWCGVALIDFDPCRDFSRLIRLVSLAP
jgi:hypothetical protein